MYDVIIFLGIPGSGKGTQAKFLAKTYNYGHISTGDLLRAIAKKNISELSVEDQKEIEKMQSGKMVSDEFIYRLVFDHIKKYFEKDTGVVLDGAIRNVEQAKRYQEFFIKQGKDASTIAIEIALDDETAIERILSRAKTSGGIRLDDAPEVIQQRMREQGNSALEPIREYYHAKDILEKIDGSKNINKVKSDITKILTRNN